MKFNEKLLDLRKKKGWSQEELGYKLDVSRQTISKWEAGQTTPELEKLVKLSEIFEISVDELIKDNENISNKIENEKDNNEHFKKSKKKSKNFLSFKKIILLVLLAIVICYGIIVANRIKIIFAVENVLIDTISKYRYLQIDKYEYNKSISELPEYSGLEFFQWQNGVIGKEKVKIHEDFGDNSKYLILYGEYDNDGNVFTDPPIPSKYIEIDERNKTYKYIEDFPIDYKAMIYYSNIFTEYQKNYNEKIGYFSIDMLSMAMDLRIKIANVNNGAMTGYYISNRNRDYASYCSLKINTLTETIVLDKSVFDEKSKELISGENYRYKYSDEAVSEEEITIPDLTGYTLVE